MIHVTIERPTETDVDGCLLNSDDHGVRATPKTNRW